MAKSTKELFTWTDDEVILLLKVTLQYKTNNIASNVDWESVSTKYSDVLERFLKHYPSPEEATAREEEFPHTPQDITKEKLTSKLKCIRNKYRKACYDGRRRGHGRVVLLHYERCRAIWAGCPPKEQLPHGPWSMDADAKSATEQLSHGVQSMDADAEPATEQLPHGVQSMDADAEPATEQLPHGVQSMDADVEPATEQLPHGVQSMDADAEPSDRLSGSESIAESESTASPQGEDRNDIPSAEAVTERRQQLYDTLGSHRRDKLKRKLSPMDQSLALQREDLSLKKQALNMDRERDREDRERYREDRERDRENNNAVLASLRTLTSCFEQLVQHMVGPGSRVEPRSPMVSPSPDRARQHSGAPWSPPPPGHQSGSPRRSLLSPARGQQSREPAPDGDDVHYANQSGVKVEEISLSSIAGGVKVEELSLSSIAGAVFPLYAFSSGAALN